MDYNEDLTRRIRTALKIFPEIFEEKKMFGGLAFLYKGKMTVGPIKARLMVRVRDTKMASELAKPFVAPMDFTGRPMKEFIYVLPEGYQSEEQLHYWITLGLEHAKQKLNES